MNTDNLNKRNLNKINNEELDELLKEDKKEDFLFDEKHKIEKGNEDKDVRFNPNLNRKEIDVVTRENQLR